MKSPAPLLSLNPSGTFAKTITALRTKRGGVLQRYHKPGGLATGAQLAVRENFFNAKEAWNDLSDEEKDVYRVRAKEFFITGYNLFIREYSPAPTIYSVSKDICTTDTISSSGLNWTNISNAQESDDAYAFVMVSEEDPTFYNTRELRGRDFGFAIPDGATILGIQVEVEKKGSPSNGTEYTKDLSVKLNKPDNSAGAENKADTGTNWPSSDAFIAYGGDSDLWSEAWTPADINSSSFGARIAGRLHTAGSAETASIDSFRITIWYEI